MKTSKDSDQTMCNDFESTTEYRIRPIIAVDYDRYLHHLEDSDIDESQKREFIDALWSVIVAFVDLGFGVHPLQQVSARDDGAYEYLLTPDAKDLLVKNDGVGEEIELLNNRLKSITTKKEGSKE
ncbi:MAG: hypothetical protein AAF542_07485 [Pseudomonadota bacterium]